MSRNAAAAEERELYFRLAPLLGSLGLFVTGIVVHRKNTEKRTSRLFYELDEAALQKFAIIQQALTHLSKSQQVWRVEGESATSDWKRHAGASALVRRTPISVGCSMPPRVETNIAIPCINLGKVRLFFLPDVILYWERKTYGAIAYDDFRIEQAVTRFVEDLYVPNDAIVVARTWRYVNKDGGPDRRFNNNRELPIVQYGVLVLTSSRGLNIHLNASNSRVSLAFSNCWQEFQSRFGRKQETQEPVNRGLDVASSPEGQAFKLLGLKTDASPEAISAAYRHLAQMYHPDKVVGLASEFQTLADKRMKEINAAHELLKGRRDQTQPG